MLQYYCGDYMTKHEVLAYCSQIMNCDIHYIDEVLPNFNRDNFLEDILKIINELKLNYNAMLELKISENSDEFDRDLAELRYKIEHIENKFFKEHNLNLNSNNIAIFAKSENGKAYFLNDLKKIPSEVYDEVLKTINLFLSGQRNAEDKVKILKNNDNFVRPVFEFKGFQVRIFATRLKENVFCIFGVAIKKADYDKKIYTNFSRRLSGLVSDGVLDDYINRLSNASLRTDLIIENNQILEDILNHLKNKGKDKDENKDEDDIELLFSDEYYDVEGGMESILEEKAIEENKDDGFSDLENNTVDVSSDSILAKEDTGISSVEDVVNIKVMPELLSGKKYKVRRETILKDYIRSNIMIMNFDELLNVVKVVSFINFERAIKYHVSIPNVPEVSFEEKSVAVKRGRKPMKETPFINYIKTSIVKFSCDELLRVKNCILDLNIDKAIGEIYDKMLIMPKHQLDRFILENYPSDDIGEKRK